MKIASDIIQENTSTHILNAGIEALAKAAQDDPNGFCILDDDSYFTSSYREECLDGCSCHCPDFMLCCAATRNPYDKDQLRTKAVEIYNKAMES